MMVLGVWWCQVYNGVCHVSQVCGSVRCIMVFALSVRCMVVSGVWKCMMVSGGIRCIVILICLNINLVGLSLSACMTAIQTFTL